MFADQRVPPHLTTAPIWLKSMAVNIFAMQAQQIIDKDLAVKFLFVKIGQPSSTLFLNWPFSEQIMALSVL